MYHLEALDACVSSWIDSNPTNISINKDTDTGANFLKHDFTKPIPEDISLILGDIIHNLRSALDYIAVEIVRKAGFGISDVHFPFHETLDGLLINIGASNLCRASAEAALIIIEEIKPYQRGNLFIWSLSRLSNTDKHRLLIPTRVRAEFPKVSIKDESQIEPRIVTFLIDANSSQEIILDGSETLNIKINSYPSPTYQIFVDETHIKPVPMLDIRTLLWHCATLIEGFIHMFEAI